MRLKKIVATDEETIKLPPSQEIELKLSLCLNATYSLNLIAVRNPNIISKITQYIKTLVNDIIVYDKEIVSVIKYKVVSDTLIGTPEYKLKVYIKDPFSYFKRQDSMFAEFTFDLSEDYSIATYLLGLENCRYIDERGQYGGKPFYTTSSEIEVHNKLVDSLKIIDQCFEQNGNMIKKLSKLLLVTEAEEKTQCSIFSVSVYENNLSHGLKFKSDIMKLELFDNTLKIQTDRYKGRFNLKNMNKIEFKHLQLNIRSILLMQEKYEFDESCTTESMLRIIEMDLI